MADVSIDRLESIRFKKIRAAGNVVVEVQGDVLIFSTSPTITVSTTPPENPAVNDLWFEPTV